MLIQDNDQLFSELKQAFERTPFVVMSMSFNVEKKAFRIGFEVTELLPPKPTDLIQQEKTYRFFREIPLTDLVQNQRFCLTRDQVANLRISLNTEFKKMKSVTN